MNRVFSAIDWKISIRKFVTNTVNTAFTRTIVKQFADRRFRDKKSVNNERLQSRRIIRSSVDYRWYLWSYSQAQAGIRLLVSKKLRRATKRSCRDRETAVEVLGKRAVERLIRPKLPILKDREFTLPLSRFTNAPLRKVVTDTLYLPISPRMSSISARLFYRRNSIAPCDDMHVSRSRR